MNKDFMQDWLQAVELKKSQLCVGIDPAEWQQREKNTLKENENKLKWCLKMIKAVAPYAAAIKPNRQYLKDFSRQEMQILNHTIHQLGMVSIDDSKLADIGDTNDAGFYHAAEEGYDAVTYAPFPGNIQETVKQATKRNIGTIVLVLMSNPEFEVIKKATINNQPGYLYFAEQAKKAEAAGIVIGAPSDKNHINEDEIHAVRDIIGEKIVLVPGIGAQGGSLSSVIRTFGKYTIANVGRSIVNANDPALEAKKFRDFINNEIR